MKYVTVITNYPGVPKGKPVIYIDLGDNIKRFSDSKDDDEFFNKWFETAKKAGDKNLSLERVIEAGDDDIIESAEYSGKNKEKISSLIKEYGYDAP